MKITKSMFLLVGWVMLFACSPDMKTIGHLADDNESPVESTYHIEIIYSDKAVVRVIMKAPRMDRYEGEKNFIEMPEGIELVFYDSLMNVMSSISANYAISYNDNELVEASNDVVVINERNEQLNTEHLVWDRNQGIIYSDKFVKITTEKEVTHGTSFRSDDRFDQWEITGHRGTFTIDMEGSGGEVGSRE